MTDLNLNTEENTTNPLRSILIAVGILVAVAIAVFALNPHKTGELTVPQVAIFAPRTEFQGMANQQGSRVMNSSTEDNLYVAATVRLKDDLRLPLFVSYAGGTMLLADGTEATATVISTRDIPKLEESFPQITAMLPHPLLDGAQASPGGTVEGQVLLLFSGATKQHWEQKKSATLTLYLAHQDPMSATIK